MRLAGAAAALSLALLTGCSGVPSEVTGALDGLASAVGGAVETLGATVDDVLGGTSVAQAREQRRDDLLQKVDDADLKAPGTLTVGIKMGETAPLAMSGSDGDLSGIDVDTAYALADALGIANVELVAVQNASSALAADCDLVMGVESGESADVMSVGYYAQSALGVFSAAEVGSVPVAASELEGRTVGVQGSSVSQVALRELGIGVTEQTFSNLNEAFDAVQGSSVDPAAARADALGLAHVELVSVHHASAALAAGTVDYVVCDAYAGAYLSCVSGSGHFAGTIDAPVAVGVGVQASSSSLQASVQEAIEEIQGNGVANIAKSRWIGEFPVLSDASRIVVVTL